ncbi:voltage-gated potassium channel [Aureococcus anophagefferens]|nr:voltage-gated potassium channel [Aureococcus anophagefferens]
MVPFYEGKSVYRAAGFKMWSAAEMVMGASRGSFMGWAYKFDWKTGDYAQLSTASINIHAQKAKDGSAFWSAIKSEEIQKTCDVDDINHVQPIEDDAKIVISSRSTNAIYKVWASNMTKIWALGGGDGDFGIVGYTGDYYAPGSSYWVGQHNAEYAADGAANASVVWEYDVGAYSQMFGDNDRLPTGNGACWWPSETINGSDAYEARVAEITRSTMETAASWTPLVWGVACDGRDLSFKVANNFKQASAYDGTYAATSAKGDAVASGDFAFARTGEKKVNATRRARPGRDPRVTNRCGDTTSVTYRC